jgi:hypothetical protein
LYDLSEERVVLYALARNRKKKTEEEFNVKNREQCKERSAHCVNYPQIGFIYMASVGLELRGANFVQKQTE